MNIRYLLIGALALIAATFSYFKFAGNASHPDVQPIGDVTGDYQEGVHYRVVEGSQSAHVGKVKVQEFFWYGCHHCEAFEPEIKQYKQAMADDVELVQVPVTWNESTSLHAAIFYVAESKKAPEEFHASMFKTIMSLRKEGNPEAHVQEAEKVFTTYGLDTESFKAELSSPEINAKLKSANELMTSLAIGGTPTLAVDGTWVVLNNAEVATAGPLNVVDYLVTKARAARN